MESGKKSDFTKIILWSLVEQEGRSKVYTLLYFMVIEDKKKKRRSCLLFDHRFTVYCDKLFMYIFVDETVSVYQFFCNRIQNLRYKDLHLKCNHFKI